MKLSEFIAFRKDLFFEGAVQADWFYLPEKSAIVAENFVFHGKDYNGCEVSGKIIDTVTLVKNFVTKFEDDSSNPLSLAIADYGTGKSHLAVTLAHLFSGYEYMPQTFSRIIHNIKQIDQNSAEIIQHSCSKKNFVIVINGMRDFNLHYEILRSTQRSLNLYGLSDEKLRKLNQTIETSALFFERNKISQLSLFESSASKYGWFESGQQLVSKIAESLLVDDTSFEIINDVYQQVTGKEISWSEGISARSVLDMLISEYCGLNGQFDHIIILFDEFGRFLEYASGSDAGKSGDSALQQIFEAAQDSGGILRVINFIQSDIKSYLVRVDQTKNLSRYIGRYDQSDKYHISSNLETVFANLVSRKNKDLFSSVIVSWQEKKENEWKIIFDRLNEWLPLNAFWSNYKLFRKVVVEGIYPLHPISTYMLSQLSDYLQNRSSLALISQYISDISDIEFSKEIPIILPEHLIRGDLYLELFSTEYNGKQRTEHCLKFDSILRKIGDKLSENSLIVLRSNLIIRILKFKTKNYEEVKLALQLCSGLTIGDLNEALEILENEYAVLSFDEHAGCFDFIEDSNGAYEYQIAKKKISNTWKSDLREVLNTARVLNLGEFVEPVDCPFSIVHNILTNEWKYVQSVILAEDVTDIYIEQLLKSWHESRSVTTSKGRLVWVYIDKDTDPTIVEKLCNLSRSTDNTPVLILLLNDSENRLRNALNNFDLLVRMDDNIRSKFGRAYSSDFNKAEEVLKNEFLILKKQRLCVTPKCVNPLTNRLNQSLSDIFEKVYPKVVSFNFDGLLTATNNFTGKGSSYYCQIIKMLLSNSISYDTIHNFSSDVRSKIIAVLMVEGATSWKCINSDYVVIPPMNSNANDIYNDVTTSLINNKFYNCSDYFENYCSPPYGLSEEAAMMLLCVIVANNYHCIRIKYNGIQTDIAKWKEKLIISDKKIDLLYVKKSQLILIDTDTIESAFNKLFNQFDQSNDITTILNLKEKIETLNNENGVPDSLSIKYKLCVSKWKNAEKSLNDWSQNVRLIQNIIDKVDEDGNIFNALIALDKIENLPLLQIFQDNGFVLTNSFKEKLLKLSKLAKDKVNLFFDDWLENSVYCKSVESISQFEKHTRTCATKLSRFGFNEFAQKLNIKANAELNKKDEIRSRQELLSDCSSFLTAFESVSLKNYSDVKESLSKAKNLLERISKYGQFLTKDIVEIRNSIVADYQLLSQASDRINNLIEKVWNDLPKVQSLDEIENIIYSILKVQEYRIPAKDFKDLEELKSTLEIFKNDIQELQNSINDRDLLHKNINLIKDKYSCVDLDFDLLPVLEKIFVDVLHQCDQLDLDWRAKYLSLNDKSRNSVLKWKDKIRVLPSYLKPETVVLVKEMVVEADKIISDAKIDDVLFYFNKLTSEERHLCLELLLKNSTMV